jgi:hypothetical protein
LKSANIDRVKHQAPSADAVAKSLCETRIAARGLGQLAATKPCASMGFARGDCRFSPVTLARDERFAARTLLIKIRLENLGVCIMKRIVLVLAFGCVIGVVEARDLGQWESTDPAIRAWYQALMQPDIPAASCCGEADAYWADSYEVEGDKYVAIITDPRPDEPLRRKHLEIGTRIVVPNYKLKFDQSNPTGHGIIFLSRGDYVYCYVTPGGV